MAAAAAAPDLDCLIAAHDKFLAGVLGRALLAGGRDTAAVRCALKALLDNCRALAPALGQLHHQVP
jgi:hypothetical protein